MRDILDTAECHPGTVGRPRDGVHYRVTDETGEPAQRLAGWLRRYRESGGLSQRELAAQAGLSVGAVRDLEQGRTARPREQSVLRLARALSLGQRERDELAALRAAAAGGRAGRRPEQTDSASLLGMLTQLHTGMAARWPDDPQVADLAGALR